MALPVYLQSFKSAGIYRVVFDKSTIEGVDSATLRLVVGYSEKGPFNFPTYVKDPQTFRLLFGDPSTKLEKRGIYFHRLALQCLSTGPIIALNLKHFNNETVGAATISTAFNDKFVSEIIDEVELPVESIYDTSRFWIKDAEQLINAQEANGTKKLNEYLNIAISDTDKTSASFFIRKANGNTVSNYNITVSDWYADSNEDIPDYLEDKKNSLLSDFFAEVYVFNGKFEPEQVLASTTLKRYFEGEYANNTVKDVKLRPYVTNAYGEKIDTLDTLYADPNSSAIGHYVGCLIPEFRDKRGNYISLNIVFNNDIENHNMLMSFNTDLLDEGYNIDLSGKTAINSNKSPYMGEKALTVTNLFNIDSTTNPGKPTTRVLGNSDSPVKVSKLSFANNLPEDAEGKVDLKEISQTETSVVGHMYVKAIAQQAVTPDREGDPTGKLVLTVADFESTPKTITIEAPIFETSRKEADNLLNKFSIIQTNEGTEETPVWKYKGSTCWINADGTAKSDTPWVAVVSGELTKTIKGCSHLITSIKGLENYEVEDPDATTAVSGEGTLSTTYKFNSASTKVDKLEVNLQVTDSVENNDQVYADSVAFIKLEDGDGGDVTGNKIHLTNRSLMYVCRIGDAFLANEQKEDQSYKLVYVQTIEEDENGGCKVAFSGNIKVHVNNNTTKYLIKVASSLNQEIGTLKPVYLKGYTYENSKPASTSMYDKLQWQHYILSTLEYYKGLRTGLLNKSDIDYRYIVDTFESYVESDCKVKLAYLAQQKQNAFAILNFPSVKTFVKCPYTSFTQDGHFNVQYIVDGKNKKKSSTVSFSLPAEVDGASFCAFYTPLKFGEGYYDSIIPSAGLVSNLFIDKYVNRQPYYIIAGPNYGAISASNLIGPDYNYSQEELHIIEPYGVNCMVYRPGFGTFINANQTAKQTPKSALSAVNVRELVIYLQDEIEKVLQANQWEFNTTTTRQRVKDKADEICSRTMSNGGIQAYLNICDESNNTPDVIDNEMFILSTHIEPGRGAGKMVQELTIYKTGGLNSSISES